MITNPCTLGTRNATSAQSLGEHSRYNACDTERQQQSSDKHAHAKVGRNLQHVLQCPFRGWAIGDVAREKNHLHQRAHEALTIDWAVMLQQTACKHVQRASLRSNSRQHPAGVTERY